MNNQNFDKTQFEQGFLNIGVIIAIAVVVAVGGYFLIQRTPTAVAPTPSPTLSDSPDGTICTQDAKLCPDGSYVGRTGPKCEFKCPTVKLSTYTSTKYNFSLQYPVDWQLNTQNQDTVIFYKNQGEDDNEIYLVTENNPNRLSTGEWLKAVKVNTASSTTFQVNSLTAIKITDNTSLPTIHVYMATGDKVAHFFVEKQTDYMEIFNKMVLSFKLNK